MKINKEEIKLKYQYPVLTEEQLKVMDEDLSHYWVEKKVTFPKEDTVRFVDWKNWYIAHNGMNQYGAVIVDEAMIDNLPCAYKLLENRQKQWLKWRGKKENGNGKIEGLDELANKWFLN